MQELDTRNCAVVELTSTVQTEASDTHSGCRALLVLHLGFSDFQGKKLAQSGVLSTTWLYHGRAFLHADTLAGWAGGTKEGHAAAGEAVAEGVGRPQWGNLNNLANLEPSEAVFAQHEQAQA